MDPDSQERERHTRDRSRLINIRFDPAQRHSGLQPFIRSCHLMIHKARKYRWLLATVGLFVLFLFWYNWHFSMERALPLKGGNPDSDIRILIATQGSRFKEAIVTNLAIRFTERGWYFESEDIDRLTEVDESAYDLIVVLHTWEMWQPPKPVERFMHHTGSRDKLIVVTTSGDGHYRMDSVDAITSESLLVSVPEVTDRVWAKVEAILGKTKDR